MPSEHDSNVMLVTQCGKVTLGSFTVSSLDPLQKLTPLRP